MFLKDNQDLLISLYKESLQQLNEDLKIVKHDTTRSLIEEEIKSCEKRLKHIEEITD